MGIEQQLLEQAFQQGYKKGFKIGYEEAVSTNITLPIAKRCKEAGICLEHISKATGLSLEEIEKL